MTDTSKAPDASYLVGTPGSVADSRGVTGFATLLRLGGVSADEAGLQQDPSVTTAPKLIDASYSSAFSAGTLSYSLGTTQIVAPNSYMRFGAAAPYESWLQSDPNAAIAVVAPPATAAASKFSDPGVLLHSTETINLFAPTINQTAKTVQNSSDSISHWSGDSLSVVFDRNSAVSSVTSVTADATGVVSTSSLQTADNHSTLLGNSVSSIVGSSATIWAGNDASTGVGSLLWSNFGTTQNVFGGSIVNITNDSVEVQGWGSAKMGDMEMVAPATIQFAVSPLAVAGLSLTTRFMNVIQAFNAVAATAMAAMTVGAALTVEVGSAVSALQNADRDTADAKMKGYMNDYTIEMHTLSAVVFAIQIAGVVAGLGAKVAAEAATAAAQTGILIGNGGIFMTAGATTLALTPAGFTVNAPSVTMTVPPTVATLVPLQWNVV